MQLFVLLAFYELALRWRSRLEFSPVPRRTLTQSCQVLPSPYFCRGILALLAYLGLWQKNGWWGKISIISFTTFKQFPSFSKSVTATIHVPASFVFYSTDPSLFWGTVLAFEIQHNAGINFIVGKGLVMVPLENRPASSLSKLVTTVTACPFCGIVCRVFISILSTFLSLDVVQKIV